MHVLTDRAFALKWAEAVCAAGCLCGSLTPEERGTCPACLTALGAKRAIRKRWPTSVTIGRRAHRNREREKALYA